MYIDNSSDSTGVSVDASTDNITQRYFHVLLSSVRKMNAGFFADINDNGNILSKYGVTDAWADTAGGEAINVEASNNLVQFSIPLANWNLEKDDIFGFRVVATGNQITDGAYDTAPADNTEAYDVGYQYGYILGSIDVAQDVAEGKAYTIK